MPLLTGAWSLLGGCLFVGAGLVVAVTVKRLFFPDWRGSLGVTTVVLIWLCWALTLGQLLGAVGWLWAPALLGAAVSSAAGAVAWARAAGALNHDRHRGQEAWPSAVGAVMATAGAGAASREAGATRADAAAAAAAGADAAAAGADAAAERADAAAARDDGNAWVVPNGLPEPSASGLAAMARPWQESVLTVSTVLVVLFVAAIWTARTVIALRRGMNDPDSLAYHIPFSVMFTHTGTADQNRLVLPFLPVQFYPANDELLSALFLTVTRSLAFAVLKNLLFGGFVVVAAHALGKAFGASRLTVAATAVVLGMPVVAFSQPGEATNDTLLLLVLVGGLALLAHARDRPAAYILALACAGLALGVKFSGIVPAATLAAMAVVLLAAKVPRHRWRWAGLGLLLSGVMGGSWYLRNVIRYGNPVPPVHLALGPFQLRTIHGAVVDQSFSVAHYAVRGQHLGLFTRGFVRGLGPFIVVIAALCVWGVLAGLRSGNGFRRGLSAVGAVALVGYLVTPASAYGPIAILTWSFVVNLHYAAPPLLAGVLAGALAVRDRRWAWAVPVVGVLAVAFSIRRGQGIAVWAPEIGGRGFALLLVAAVVGAAACAARMRPSLRRFVAAGLAAAAVVAAAGLMVTAGRSPARRASDPLLRWAATVPGARIATWVGSTPDLINTANLYGPHERNQVTILHRLVDGAALPVDTCASLKAAVRDGHFEFVAATVDTEGYHWLQTDPAFRIVANETIGASRFALNTLRRYSAVVFQTIGSPDVNCPGRLTSETG